MLKHGYLAGTLFYPSICHTHKIVDDYLHCAKLVLEQIREFTEGKDVYSMLSGGPCHNGFKRLN